MNARRRNRSTAIPSRIKPAIIFPVEYLKKHPDKIYAKPNDAKIVENSIVFENPRTENTKSRIEIPINKIEKCEVTSVFSFFTMAVVTL